MLFILSPAKTLDYSRTIDSYEQHTPQFSAEADQLAKALSQLSFLDFQELMQISDALTTLNRQRFAEWNHPETPLNHALAIFKGEAYNGLDAVTMDRETLELCNSNLRILSGLYGVLRPFDLIKPYRLEMGKNLKLGSLYAFWREKITASLQADLKRVGGPLVNLASLEYSKSIDMSALGFEVITPVFMEKKSNGFRVISVYAKKARGMMVRFAMDEKANSVEALKQFARDGYGYNELRSTTTKWVFTRG